MQQPMTEADPRQRAANSKRMLHDTAQHAREDVETINDPKAKALFETTAETLQGLMRAYEHYEQGVTTFFPPEIQASLG
jgi:hypothetical protein